MPPPGTFKLLPWSFEAAKPKGLSRWDPGSSSLQVELEEEEATDGACHYLMTVMNLRIYRG